VSPDGFLDRYNCGICSRGDWKKFVDSLKYMLADNRYIKFGQNGRKYVELNHDITKIIGEYKTRFTESYKPGKKKSALKRTNNTENTNE